MSRGDFLNRRQFLRDGARTALAFTALSRLAACAHTAPGYLLRGYGDLRPDPDGILDLPPDFRYTILARRGDPMDDGLIFPGRPDGMAAFPGPGGRTVLLCNHELDPSEFWRSFTGNYDAFGKNGRLLSRLDASKLYDRRAGRRPAPGGVSAIVLAPRAGDAPPEVEARYLRLGGTMRNCAGGPAPWNAWISCEENVKDADADEGYLVDHGYAFEVPVPLDVSRPELVAAVPLKAMGRFRREAVAIDPHSHVVYQTEDRPDGLLYRFVPEERATGSRRTDLSRGGRLQALRLIDAPGALTNNRGALSIRPGETLAVDWVDLDEPEAPLEDLRLQGRARGAAVFDRGEGMWFGDGEFFFACTTGGLGSRGQIWRYRAERAKNISVETKGVLELFLEPRNSDILENADNLCVAPNGDLIVCEDGPGNNYLLGIKPDGGVYRIARNAGSWSELCGACFSADGRTLFVNLQLDGLVLAIEGPFKPGR